MLILKRWRVSQTDFGVVQDGCRLACQPSFVASKNPLWKGKYLTSVNILLSPCMCSHVDCMLWTFEASGACGSCISRERTASTLGITGWMGFSGPQSGGRVPPVGSGSNIVTVLTEPSGVTQLYVAAYRPMNNWISTWVKNNPRTFLQ